jgi:hypothetical protein
VTDQSGAVAPNVEVKLNDLYVTRTNADGKFIFQGLPVGKYRLFCHAPGFRDSVIEGIPVADGHVTRADILLQLGR